MLPTTPILTIPKKIQRHAQRAIAIAYKWTVRVALPWIGRRIITNSNFWMAIATVVIAVATIAYTHYARQQWGVMNSTLAEIQKQTPEIQKQAKVAQDQFAQAKIDSAAASKVTDEQLRIAQEQATAATNAVQQAAKESATSAIRVEKQLQILQTQANATRDQADAALKSAIAIQKQTDISERPWLSVEIAPASDLHWVDDPKGKYAGLAFKLSIKNVGKSIAKNIQIDLKFLPTEPGFPLALGALNSQKGALR